MNLELSRQLLIAAEQDPGGRLKIQDRESVREIALMIDAGFIEGSGPSEKDPETAEISLITEAGRKFARAMGYIDQATTSRVIDA